MSGPVLVRVHALDPISESGILAQLRECPDIRVADGGDRGAEHGPQPSVALAVIDLADDDSTSWLRGLHRRNGLPLVLVVGQLDSRALVTVVESGVRAVTRRCEATPARLSQLLRAAAANCGELPPDLLGQLLDQVGELNRSQLGPRGLNLNGLTQRENTILRLVADGLSTREVASQLAYSERTIKAVLQELTTRLYLRNRTHAVAHAVRNGWI
jgi:DNA-binding NarL/FixJ family response regulator